MYLDNVDDKDLNPGVTSNDDLNMPSVDNYRDMIIDEQPEEDDEKVINKYLNVELLMNVGTNDKRCGHVIKQSWGVDGGLISHAHTNPLFDTHEYEVEFTDGTCKKYQANVITENMYAQLDDEGNQFLMLEEITDHCKDAGAISIADGAVQSCNGELKPKKMMQGWKLLVHWRDGSISWEKLKDLKESNPIEVAKYAIAN